MAQEPKKPLAVATVQHRRERRRNNPTMELQSFLTDEEAAPERVSLARTYSPAAQPELYDRNKALDPQLVWADSEDGQGKVQLAWRGKDEQDAEPLSVDAVPIYTAEKIHPKAIIDDIRRQAAAGAPDVDAPDLFADFNGIDEEDRLDFYQHTLKWTNRLVLGDSLQVMASLAQKEDLRGKVQCIYFDPPYGIKFNSNWQISTRSREVQDGKANDRSREPEQVKAFRDTWADGIHSYLSYLRDRLMMMRDLLTESGSIFVQIGDENVHRVRAVMDEVFAAENIVSEITVQKAGSIASEYLGGVSDFIIWFAKDRSNLKYRSILLDRALSEDERGRFTLSLREDGRVGSEEFAELQSSDPVAPDPLQSASIGREKGEGAASWFPVSLAGRTFTPTQTSRWKTNEIGMARLKAATRLIPLKSTIRYARRLSDFPVAVITNIWSDMSGATDKSYVVQTSTKIVERCILMATDPGDLVLDPTCGSGTTAYVAEQWGRRWITIDTSRVALTLARTRLMGARYPWYVLKDSEAGAVQDLAFRLGRKPTEAEAAEARSGGPFTNDIAHGLVLHRVPHITLKSIASNKAIDVIWDQWQEKLEPLLAELNNAAKTAWDEWQVPRAPVHPWNEQAAKAHAKVKALLLERERMRSNWDRGADEFDETDIAKQDKKIGKVIGDLNKLLGRSFTIDNLPEHAGYPLPTTALTRHKDWWEARIGRQKEIDAAIVANAETEYLVDKPVELKGTVRVAGPFTVDSLSPHRVLPADEDDPMLLASLEEDGPTPNRLAIRTASGETSDDFMRVVLDNLKVAGVGNTKKGERLRFASIRPFAGHYVNAEGRYTEGESDGAPERRAAIFIGPEYDTVTRAMIVAAAREAVDTFDTLIVCGFAFEAHASPETMTLGRLTMLKVNMNQDLRMGDRLKTADQGNLFVVFGEPDVNFRARSDGEYEVEIKGVDIFNPNTGEQKSSGKVEDDVACWFVDDDYDETSFFVRQAYFLGGKDPYEKLKAALKAELDDDAWRVLNSTVSRPFPAPSTGKIAVKVINHYGDEVMKVYSVAKTRG
ncbi:site-specific DNA-methyltransferase [Mesorhizobium sp. LSHC414A00]|uniref:site-specific DNA-methyltransferase n=1 Tax=Mesorhizobium sp. LSHC414A00 TaxID=1287287 RepID=UPI0003CDEFE1|nr:site-specific DNA-methyltransferase [Mesorhizobium sp. LSHC414A00]ESX79382.1 DNA methylase [Mesorhizobium sp. LSHC414A00]